MDATRTITAYFYLRLSNLRGSRVRGTAPNGFDEIMPRRGMNSPRRGKWRAAGYEGVGCSLSCWSVRCGATPDLAVKYALAS